MLEGSCWKCVTVLSSVLFAICILSVDRTSDNVCSIIICVWPWHWFIRVYVDILGPTYVCCGTLPLPFLCTSFLTVPASLVSLWSLWSSAESQNFPVCTGDTSQSCGPISTVFCILCFPVFFSYSVQFFVNVAVLATDLHCLEGPTKFINLCKY